MPVSDYFSIAPSPPSGGVDAWPTLQAWADGVVAAGQSGVIPAGTYNLAQPLRIGTVGGTVKTGVRILGAGPGQTVLNFNAAMSELVNLTGQTWRRFEFGNMSLQCSTDLSPIGLHHTLATDSRSYFHDINIMGPTTHIYRTAGGGQNGERTIYERIESIDFGTFFYDDDGQAYNPIFVDCIGMPNRNGSTGFKLVWSGGGGGLRVDNFMASPTAVAFHQSNFTLLDLTGGSAPITFVGGRVENLTRLVHVSSGGYRAYSHSPITFTGFQGTTDCKPGDSTDTTGAFVYLDGGGSAGIKLVIQSSDFYTAAGSVIDQCVFKSATAANSFLEIRNSAFTHTVAPVVNDNYWNNGVVSAPTLTKAQCVVTSQLTDGTSHLITL